MSTRSYSDRLGRIADSQFQEALDEFGLGRLIAAEPVSSGHSGQNVFLASSSGEWVLRGRPSDASQLPRERFMIGVLQAKTTVSVPWPYLVDESDDIFGWSFAIMPRLPGLQLVDRSVRASLDSNSRVELARELGRTLSEMHSCTWPYAGEYDRVRDGIAPLATDHASWITTKVEMLLERTPGIRSGEKAWARALFSSTQEALHVPFTPCFVMMDFHENNILATQDTDGTWQLGVVDFESAYVGDGERDVVRCCAAYAVEEPELARPFVQMYAANSPFRPGHGERIRAYMLLDRLAVWGFALRYGKWWDDALPFQAWGEPFTYLDV